MHWQYQIFYIQIQILSMRSLHLSVIFFILFLAVLAAQSHPQLSPTPRMLQASQRSQLYYKFCQFFPNRTNIVNSKTRQQAKQATDMLKSTFTKSGNQIFNSIFVNKIFNTTGFEAQVSDMKTPIALFAGPFAIGLVILILLWPFLCCCCICPKQCISKCCSKPLNQQYTTYQLCWPSFFLIISFMLIVVPSAIGISRSNDIEKSYQSVGCSLSIAIDDILNGNTSKQGRYFIGISNFLSGITQLDSNLNGVREILKHISFSNDTGSLKKGYNKGKELLDEVSKIPNGIINGSLEVFSYQHFDGANGTINSIFPNKLGSANQVSAVKVSYTGINSINGILKKIGEYAEGFVSKQSEGNQTIKAIKSSMADTKIQLNSFEQTIMNIERDSSRYFGGTNVGLIATFASFIFLGLLGIITTIIMSCFHKYSCRYLLYFLCGAFLVLGFLTFLVAILFSLATPIIFLGCDFLTFSLLNSSNFKLNFGKIVDGQIASYLSVCLPGSSGDLLAELSGVNLQPIRDLSNGLDQLRKYNYSQLQTASEVSLSSLRQFIDAFYYTDMIDFNSSSDFERMKKISNSSMYPGCNNSEFKLDSWVPSLRMKQIECSVINKASLNECPTKTHIQNSSDQCLGCMDTTKIFYQLYQGANPINDITTRYNFDSIPFCAQWKQQIGTLWNKYYDQKYQKLNPVHLRMAATIANFENNQTGYKAKLADVGQTFNNINQQLTNLVSSVVDDKYGLLVGRNCLVLGEDLNLVLDTTCTSLFVTFYFLRLILGIIAFGMLLSLCFITCTGVRAFKYMERLARKTKQGSQQNRQYSQVKMMIKQ